MKKILICLVAILLISGCSNSKVNSISPEEVYNLIENHEENITIIDVRELDEYKSGHLKTAINIPLGKIESISDLDIKKDNKIILYCRSGVRSKEAADKLKSLGYTNLFDMGGITSWNYDLEK